MKKEIQVAVIGGGMIGLSMCVLMSGNGVRTTLYVRNRVEERRKKYNEILDGLQQDGFLTEEDKIKCASYFRIVTSYEELQETNIAFECVAENLDVKKETYINLKQNCPKLLAVVSSTSAISSESLALCSTMQDKVFVAHPFYPPHLIPCVEVVPNSYTSESALRAVMELLEYVKREAVVIKKDAPGFVANRLQYAMLREAIHIVEEGIALPEDVDRVLKYSFIPRYTSIGIFEHFDNCGLDLTADICRYLYPELCTADSVQNLVQKHCEKEEYGVKSKKGIYDWEKKDMEDFRERIKQPYLKYFSWNIPQKSYEGE